MSREIGEGYLEEVCEGKATIDVESRYAAAVALMSVANATGIAALVSIVQDNNAPRNLRIAAATYLLSMPKSREAEHQQEQSYGGTV